jgi:hypothetical protein
MPTALMKMGITTIIMAVKTRLSPTARVSSSFLARQAAAVAMAAETPQTLMSALIVMLRVLEGIFTTVCPKM